MQSPNNSPQTLPALPLLFDIQCAVGAALHAGKPAEFSVQSLLSDLQKFNISRALVRLGHCEYHYDLLHENKILFSIARENTCLLPCPLVIPSAGSDFPSEETQVADALAHDSGGVWIRPLKDTWVTEPWCAGKLFKTLEKARLPVLCPISQVPYTNIAAIAEKYPRLPLIIIMADYRSQHIILPLLKTFRNVYLSTGNNYIVHHGLEQLAAAGLIRQLLFGTNFPASDCGPAISYLNYSDLPVSHKKLIACENYLRLLKGIKK